MVKRSDKDFWKEHDKLVTNFVYGLEMSCENADKLARKIIKRKK